LWEETLYDLLKPDPAFDNAETAKLVSHKGKVEPPVFETVLLWVSLP
jgi:hypothetical protein